MPTYDQIVVLASWTERAVVLEVVGDIPHLGLDTEPRPEVYRPFAVNPLGAPILVIRTGADPGPMASSLSAAVRSVDAEVPAYDVFLMEALVDRSTMERRFVMLLFNAYAWRGVVAGGARNLRNRIQSVVQRTQETGCGWPLGHLPKPCSGWCSAPGCA